MATTIGVPPAAEAERSPAESVAHVSPTADSHPEKRERLISLDVFRGLTIAGMLL